MTAIVPVDESQYLLYKIREAVNDASKYGVVPASALTLLPATRFNFNSRSTIIRSEQNRPLRARGPSRRVYLDSQGDIELEMAYGPVFDAFLEEMACSQMSADLAISETTISFDDTDNSINGSGGTEFANAVEKTWIRISTTSGTNDGDYWVETKSSNGKLILGYGTLTTEDAATAGTVAVSGAYLRNGNDRITSSYEKKYDLTSPVYGHYPAVVLSRGVLRFEPGQLVKLTGTIMGKGVQAFTASTVGTGAPIDGGALDHIVDANNNMSGFRVNGTLEGNVRTFVLDVNNNVELVEVDQTTGPNGFSLGDCQVSGEVEGYFVDPSTGRVADALSRTAQEFQVKVGSDAGGDYYFTVFKAYYDEIGDRGREATRGASKQSLPWQAEEDTTVAAGVQWQVCKFPVA